MSELNICIRCGTHIIKNDEDTIPCICGFLHSQGFNKNEIKEEVKRYHETVGSGVEVIEYDNI